MKLYFMIGLPTEEESDVREIVRVGARALEVGRRLKKERRQAPPKVTVSVSTHVPKPHTPFQWCAMDRQQEVRKKQGWLAEEQRQTGVDLRMHDSEGSWLEGVFARGDRSLCDVLETAWKNGARFDSWEDQLQLEIWEKAFSQHGIEPGRFLGTIPVTARLPWSHIDVGLEEGFLLSEYRKALKNRLSLPCGKAAGMFIHHTNLADAQADARRLVCYDCGVACDLSAMREQRLDYLTKLGAAEKRVRLPVASAPAPVKRGPPPRIVQGEPLRYRFGYTKAGPSALLSHLDLIRALPRSFRRVDIPLFYSSGFHPKPDMVFGPALSLGVYSTFELVDMKLTVAGDPKEWLLDLSAASPDGLEFFDAVALGPGDKALGKIIDTVRYAVAFPKSVLGARGGEAWLRERAAWFAGVPSARVLRRIDGVGKWVDVKKFVKAVAVGDEAARGAIEHAGLVGDFVVMSVDVLTTGDGSTKISEVIEVLARKDGDPDDAATDAAFGYRAVRAAMGRRGEGGALVSPFDLEALRVPVVTAPAPELVAAPPPPAE